jgi:hypothetical protein
MNEKCKVFLDLAEILSEAIDEKKTSRLTWIVIVLIIISIIVTLVEVIMRASIVSRRHDTSSGAVCNCNETLTSQTVLVARASAPVWVPMFKRLLKGAHVAVLTLLLITGAGYVMKRGKTKI